MYEAPPVTRTGVIRALGMPSCEWGPAPGKTRALTRSGPDTRRPEL